MHNHVNLLLWEEGKNCFTKCGAMDGNLSADGHVHPQYMSALRNSNGYHFTIGQYSKGRRFSALFLQFFEIGAANCCEVKARHRSRSQLQQLGSQAVFTCVKILFGKAMAFESSQ